MTIAKMDKISPSNRLVSVVDVFVAFIRGDEMSLVPSLLPFTAGKPRKRAKAGIEEHSKERGRPQK